MDAKTLEALKGSIAKWEAIVAGTGEDRGADNCHLCAIFRPNRHLVFTPNQEPCLRCPVREASGEPYCRNTPYEAWDAVDSEDGRADTPEAKAAAQAELDFIRSLLPPAEGA